MSNYWLHRISWKSEVSYPLLFEKGKGHENFLSIGWQELAAKYPGIRDDNNDEDFYKQRVKEIYSKYDGFSMRTYRSLWNFIQFKKDDLIVIPTRDKDFVVCKVLEDKTYTFSEMEQSTITLYNLGANVDLGFFKKVEVLNSDSSNGRMPRNGYADTKLTARMKIRQTNANIEDIKSSVDDAIKNFRDKKPISLYGVLQEKFIDESINKIHKLLSSPENLEKLVKSYFEHIGASSVDIPAKNEKGKRGDADIKATFEALKLIIYTQAKFHEGESDSWAVEQISDYGSSKENIDDCYTRVLWVISTGNTFSDKAIDAATKNKVQLINGKEFVKMLLDVGLQVFVI